MQRQLRVLTVGDHLERPTRYKAFDDIWTDVEARTRQAAMVVYFPELEEGFASWAVARVKAGAGFDLDKERQADRLALAELQSLEREREVQKAQVAEASDRLVEVEQARERRRKRLGRLGVWGPRVGIALVTILAVVAGTTLLTPAFDGFVLRAYLVDLFGEGTERFAATIALYGALAVALAVFVPLGVATLFTGGRTSTKLKVWYFILVELMFAISFWLLRGDAGLSAQGVAWSGLELAIGFAYTLALSALGTRLLTESKAAEEWRGADQEAGDVESRVRRLRGDLAVIDESFAAQHEVVQAREETILQLERDMANADQTARLAYKVTLSAMNDEANQEGQMEVVNS